MAKCLHQLIGPMNVKKSKRKKEMVKKEVTTFEKPALTKPTFVWISGHQMAFDTLEIALTTAPVLGYPSLNRELI